MADEEHYELPDLPRPRPPWMIALDGLCVPCSDAEFYGVRKYHRRCTHGSCACIYDEAMDTSQGMRQFAPYPRALAELVQALDYRTDRGWAVKLTDMVRDYDEDGGGNQAGGLTLTVLRVGPDAYNPGQVIAVNHHFPVPAATYDRRSWQRWLFDQLGLVDDHERMEDFTIAGVKPYAPSHGPGNSPYFVREVGTELDQRTQYTGRVAATPASVPGMAYTAGDPYGGELRYSCEHQESGISPCAHGCHQGPPSP